MRLVIVESPYAGDIETNTTYARAAVRDALQRGEAPIASHLLYPQFGILREEVPEERLWGMDAGREWYRVADAVVFYVDLGWSHGMQIALQAAEDAGIPTEERTIAGWRAPCPVPPWWAWWRHQHEWRPWTGGWVEQLTRPGNMRPQQCSRCGAGRMVVY